MRYPFDCISNFIFVETEIQPADVILVPGSADDQNMIKAAELFHNGMAPYILPSGGENKKTSGFVSEWEMFRQAGLRLGVPDEAILKEDRAKNTFENARFSLAVLKEKGIKVEKAILVCKAYHSRRALLTYQTIFPREISFYVSTVSGRRGITRDNWYMDDKRISVVMKEVVKIGSYFEEEIAGLERKYGNA